MSEDPQKQVGQRAFSSRQPSAQFQSGPQQCLNPSRDRVSNLKFENRDGLLGDWFNEDTTKRIRKIAIKSLLVLGLVLV